MMTVYCGLFFIVDQPEIYNSEDQEILILSNGLKLSNKVKVVMFALIMASNLAFLSYWCYKMSQEVKIVLLKKFQKVYLVIFVCFDKEKLQKNYKKMEKAEVNEVLREDFMKTIKQVKSLYKTGELVLSDVVLEKLGVHLHPKLIMKVAG